MRACERASEFACVRAGPHAPSLGWCVAAHLWDCGDGSVTAPCGAGPRLALAVALDLPCSALALVELRL
eukprot:12495055-Alexandrium_andersonii.AAC.1